jgi:hypothetical protein
MSSAGALETEFGRLACSHFLLILFRTNALPATGGFVVCSRSTVRQILGNLAATAHPEHARLDSRGEQMKKSWRFDHSRVARLCKSGYPHAIFMGHLHYLNLLLMPSCAEKAHNSDHFALFRSFFPCLFGSSRPIVPINEDCVFCRESLKTVNNASIAVLSKPEVDWCNGAGQPL